MTRIQVTLTAEEVEFVYRDSKETRSLMQLSHDRKRGEVRGSEEGLGVVLDIRRGSRQGGKDLNLERGKGYENEAWYMDE